MKDVARQAAAKVFQDYDEEGRESFQREVADAVAEKVLQKIVGEMPMSNIDRAHVYVRSLLAEFSAPEGRPEPAAPPAQAHTVKHVADPFEHWWEYQVVDADGQPVAVCGSVATADVIASIFNRPDIEQLKSKALTQTYREAVR